MDEKSGSHLFKKMLKIFKYSGIINPHISKKDFFNKCGINIKIKERYR